MRRRCSRGAAVLRCFGANDTGLVVGGMAAVAVAAGSLAGSVAGTLAVQ